MYDLVVIGGGSAGITFAKFAPQFGAKVAVIEAHRLGGDCTWTGCVPSKTLIHAARAAHTIRTASHYGLHSGPLEVDFAAVMAHVHAVQTEIYTHDDAPDVLERAGATVIMGRARFRNAEALEVDGRLIEARHYCIATGSSATIPPIEGLREAGFITNENIFELRTLPQRLLVIGGGPIGCELGQALARFGSNVTIVQSASHLLPKDDHELGAVLKTVFEAEGITVYLKSRAVRVRHDADGKHVDLQLSDGTTTTIVVDEILVAAGRSPNLSDLGLDVAGIEFDEHGIKVDAHLRTTNPRVFACGDVIGRYQFTHMAGAEAGVVIRNAFFPGSSAMNYTLVPWATFTDPEVAHAGLNEDQAREQYGKALNVFHFPWANNDRARTEGDITGFTKILTVGRKHRIVGAHLIGLGAGELIHEIVVAMGAGLGLSAVSGPIHVYPTRAIGIRNAAQQASIRTLQHPIVKRFLRGYFRVFGAKS